MKDWRLIWSDDFDGPEVDRTNWNVVDTQDVTEIHNKELQVYKPGNVYVADSSLVLEAREEKSMDRLYTSGKVTTYGLREFKYGKFVARIKITSITAMWPAFWLMGTNGDWPACAEIDVMEGRGRLPKETCGALHWGTCRPHHVCYSKMNYFPDGTDMRDWHEYSVEWTPRTISIRTDGRLFLSKGIKGMKYFDQPFFLLLNMAVGGDFDAGRIPEPGMLPQRMYVDWVRVYRTEG